MSNDFVAKNKVEGNSSVQNYSVLMSVYAKEKPEYLEQSMRSIYEQTIPTNDFVLICDGPLTDELDAVIAKMQKKFGKRLNVVCYKKNRGLGEALRDGILNCKNELIMRMDADDISLPTRAEKQLRVFQKNDVDVISSNITEYDEKMQTKISERIVPETHAEIEKFIKTRNPMNHMAVMYKKSHVISAGNYQPMPGFEDYYLWARMLKNDSKFYNIQENLVKVRGGDSLMVRRGGKAYVHSIKEFEERLYKLGIINIVEYLKNVQTRKLISYLPNGLRFSFYSTILRKSGGKS